MEYWTIFEITYLYAIFYNLLIVLLSALNEAVPQNLQKITGSEFYVPTEEEMKAPWNTPENPNYILNCVSNYEVGIKIQTN